jgi:hypothetical protein
MIDLVSIGSSSGSTVQMDYTRLAETGLLACASSGGGKTNLLRAIAESTGGRIPFLFIDPEGELSSLRKVLDCVLVGRGGDFSIDPAHAGTLAKRLLELNASAIMDIYELKPHERHRFVRLFVESLVDAPKTLWAPRLVLVDEAHMFCPEKGEGVSEAREALTDLASRGRKRGYRPILATQRLAKLSKDAAAECWNKLVGLTTYGDDRDRGVKELGLKRDAGDVLLHVDPGQFMALGPAFHLKGKKPKEAFLMDVFLASTKPTQGRKTSAKAPSPGEKVKAVLSRLQDLPREAAREAQTVEALRREISELKMKIRNARPAPVVAAPAPKIDYEGIKNSLRKELIPRYRQIIREHNKKAEEAMFGADVLLDQKDFARLVLSKAPAPAVHARAEVKKQSCGPFEIPEGVEAAFGKCERAIVGFLKTDPGRAFKRVQIGVGTGYSMSSGGFNNALGHLRATGCIQGMGDSITLGPQHELCQSSAPAPNPLQAWRERLGKCERMIWERIECEPTRIFTKEELGEVTGYSPTSGGFNNSLGRLHSLGLIVRRNGGIQLNPEVAP